MATERSAPQAAASTTPAGAGVIDTIAVAGHRYSVRVAQADDVEAVLELYRRLDVEDLHRRFFSAFRPERDFVEHWLDRSRRGGEVIVVVEHTDTAGDRIIADAGYVPTGSDLAELAMTIDPQRRGWLGPYLLDLLVGRAAANGIENLTADVLTTNCAMLALLKARGCVFMPSDDPAVARLMIGTGTGTTARWPIDSPHPRVIVEGSTGSWAGFRASDQDAISVLVCPGPKVTSRCPLLIGDHCPLVDDADAVVVALDPDAPSTEVVLKSHERRRDAPTQPIALSARLRSHRGDIAGRATWVIEPGESGPEAVARVVEAIEDADDTAADRDGAHEPVDEADSR